jgi:hypothetical protein
MCRSPLALVAPLRDGMGYAALPEQISATGVAVAFVGDEVTRPLARTTTTDPWHPYLIQDRLKLATLMALTAREHDRKRASFPITTEVHLGGKSSLAPSKRLIGRIQEPLFASSLLLWR